MTRKEFSKKINKDLYANLKHSLTVANKSIIKHSIGDLDLLLDTERGMSIYGIVDSNNNYCGYLTAVYPKVANGKLVCERYDKFNSANEALKEACDFVYGDEQ